MMRAGSVVPTREHLQVKKMLADQLVRLKSGFDGEIKEIYGCKACGAEWQMAYEQDNLTLGTGIKVLTKLKPGTNSLG